MRVLATHKIDHGDTTVEPLPAIPVCELEVPMDTDHISRASASFNFQVRSGYAIIAESRWKTMESTTTYGYDAPNSKVFTLPAGISHIGTARSADRWAAAANTLAPTLDAR